MFWFTQEPSSGNYIQRLANITCSTVRVGTDVVRVMATYFDWNKRILVCCVQFTVQRSTRILLLQSEYATITMTMSVPTRTVEQDL